MDVRIGTTLDGQATGFDTRSACPLLLVGDVGRGKTTTARYLTRWWLASTARHAHVYAEAPSEWADLCGKPEHPDQLEQAIGRGCRPGTCLVVVDDMDVIGGDRLSWLPLGTCGTILTSYGNGLAGRPLLLGIDFRCLGLVRPAHADSADPVEAAVLHGQGRLDWPYGTIAVIPDQRGQMDFPCHRWEAPAGRTRAVPR
ncbi:MAG: ATP-binding protein [Nocardioides sp.]|uniref:ATP-binding protein n=1 Tax=Nocardioides sp. TaxID=35761 RepID=UPI0032643279